MANKLQLNLLITCSAVLPSNAADKPVLPTVPKITNSASISFATSGITSSGKPRVHGYDLHQYQIFDVRLS